MLSHNYNWKVQIIQPITKVYELKYKDAIVGVFSSMDKALQVYGKKVLALGTTEHFQIREIELDKSL